MAISKKTINRPAKKSSSAADNENIKEACFTIMPFGGWFDDYYDSIYCPAIKAAGLEPCRADDLYRPSTIVNDIWSLTQKAKIVLADLSGKNPNVFYELGLAHALAKPAILVTESIDDVPFDLRALRVLEYNKNQPRWGEILQDKITSSIKEIAQSPLQSVLPAFLSVKQETKTKAVSEHEKIMLEMRQEIDLLRREVASSKSRNIPRISASDAIDRIQRYVERGLPRSIIVRRLTDMGAPSAWVEKEVDELLAQRQIDLDGPLINE